MRSIHHHLWWRFQGEMIRKKTVSDISLCVNVCMLRPEFIEVDP